MSFEYPTSIESIPGKIEALRTHFNTGLTKDITFRKQQLNNLIRFCEENKPILFQALWNDLHKHELESDIGEISIVIEECKFMINNLDKFIKPTYTKKRFLMNVTDKTFIRKEPKGVVLVIGSWNYPINLLLTPVVGAIAAGNCVVIKPSEVSTSTSNVIATILPKYLDPRAYSIITGGVPETTAVLENRFDHIFYTGNGHVGKIVMTAAATYLTPVTLELGGKSPALITEDADVNITAHRLLWGKYFNNGQTCVAPDYVLCERTQIAPLLIAMRKAILEFYGENPQTSNSYGRIINTRQFDRLKGLLDSCHPNTIVIGGETDRDNLYIAPTVVTPVDPYKHSLMQQEIFGPILPIVPVENMDEAIAIINSRDHPLALYIFASSKYDYNKILNRTSSGGVLINDTLMHLQELSLPFGGIGPSGTGCYHGEKSFDTFTHLRSTMVKDLKIEPVASVKYPPYNYDKAQLINLLVYGFPPHVNDKLNTLVRACKSFWNVFFKRSTDEHVL
ncbi:Aldehyde/histidinol dehydrogenase [Cokeromyces recurvatus]|uniref:Aldehyde/histidinol dehydrogenase n=1 Tax=Cokeromyces recurvatus TaxID=90255 RepID=UPI002220FB15|nr:Aldehyde/histidinol dehydrogenase [Cokeromyces recurvatus]KAI7899694.1 Aldehyde/histidinol dehydrogenase [Cokeromyces recurvatus]